MTQRLSDLDFSNVAKIKNLVNGVDDQDAATVGQVNAAIDGLNWKGSVRVSTVSNIDLFSPGATIDGITMASNDRVLVMSQTSAPTNGIYIWNGAATPMTRSLDASTAAELEQAILTVEEGTNAGASFRQTSVNFTLGTNDVVFGSFGTTTPAASELVAGKAAIATQSETDAGTDDSKVLTPLKLNNYAGKVKKYSATIGDGSATSYTITHNFNTRNISRPCISRVASPYDVVEADVELTTVNSITIKFAVAPSTNQFNVAFMA